MYFLGLSTHYTRFNNRTINHYSTDFHKETYCSSTSNIIKKLVRSALYLDKQLNYVKSNNRSMAFKLLKLKFPVYRIIRTKDVHTFIVNVLYGRFNVSLISRNLIIGTSSTTQRSGWALKTPRQRNAWERIAAMYENDDSRTLCVSSCICW